MGDGIVNTEVALQVLLEQFTKAMQATVSMTQSIESLQNEVGKNLLKLTTIEGDIGAVRDKLKTLTDLVQGEGMGDSIYRTMIETTTRLRTLEAKYTKDEEHAHDAKGRNLSAILSGIGVLLSFLFGIAAFVMQFIKSGKP